MVLRDGVMERVTRVEVKSEYGGAPCYALVRVAIWTEAGAVDAAEVFHLVPLRNRRDSEIARLASTWWNWTSRMTGYGI